MDGIVFSEVHLSGLSQVVTVTTKLKSVALGLRRFETCRFFSIGIRLDIHS